VNSKYDLTGGTIRVSGRTLYQIRAKRDLLYAKKGDLGGFVESEDNLVPYGNAWVADDACVYEFARVKDDALVCQGAKIFGNATIRDDATVSGVASVSGFADVRDYAIVRDCAIVGDAATISDSAVVMDGAKIFGSCRVRGRGTIGGLVYICSQAKFEGEYNIKRENDYIIIGPIGSRGDFLTVITATGMAATGCFSGSLDELEVAAREKNREDYLDILPGIRNILERRRR